MLGPGAPRIVRAGLPDRGALLVAEGLPCAVIGRARPVRPARRRCPRGTGGRACGARDGTTPGAVTHRDRPRTCAHASVPRSPGMRVATVTAYTERLRRRLDHPRYDGAAGIRDLADRLAQFNADALSDPESQED